MLMPEFDTELVYDATDIVPQVSWGTSPEMVLQVTDKQYPNPADARDDVQKEGWQRALDYMGLEGRNAD